MEVAPKDPTADSLGSGRQHGTTKSTQPKDPYPVRAGWAQPSLCAARGVPGGPNKVPPGSSRQAPQRSSPRGPRGCGRLCGLGRVGAVRHFPSFRPRVATAVPVPPARASVDLAAPSVAVAARRPPAPVGVAAWGRRVAPGPRAPPPPRHRVGRGPRLALAHTRRPRRVVCGLRERGEEEVLRGFVAAGPPPSQSPRRRQRHPVVEGEDARAGRHGGPVHERPPPVQAEVDGRRRVQGPGDGPVDGRRRERRGGVAGGPSRAVHRADGPPVARRPRVEERRAPPTAAEADDPAEVGRDPWVPDVVYLVRSTDVARPVARATDDAGIVEVLDRLERRVLATSPPPAPRSPAPPTATPRAPGPRTVVAVRVEVPVLGVPVLLKVVARPEVAHDLRKEEARLHLADPTVARVPSIGPDPLGPPPSDHRPPPGIERRSLTGPQTPEGPPIRPNFRVSQ